MDIMTKMNANISVSLLLVLLGLTACKDTFIADSPNPPSNLRATAISDEEFVLAWDDNSATEDGFVVERGEWNQNNFTEIGRVGRDVVEYVDRTPIQAGTIFQYRIYAYRSDLNSGYSNSIERSFNLMPPRDLSFLASDPGKITLEWEVPYYPNVGIKVERSANPDGPWSQIATVTGENTFVDQSATQPGPWYYRIAASTPTNSTDFVNAVGVVYGLSDLEKKIVNNLSSSTTYCPSYTGFVLPESNRFIQFSSTFPSYRIAYLDLHSYTTGERLPNGRITLTGDDDGAYKIDLSPDKTRLMTMAAKATQIRAISDGSVLKEIPNFKGAAFLGNDKIVSVINEGTASAGTSKGRIEMYDLETDETVVFAADIRYSSIAFSGVRGLYAIYREDTRQIQVFNADSESPIVTLDTPESEVSIHFDTDGEQFGVFGRTTYTREFRVYSTDNFNLSYTAALPSGSLLRPHFAPDNKVYLSKCSRSGSYGSSPIYIVDPVAGEMQELSISGHPSFLYPTPDGKINAVYTDSIRTFGMGWMRL